MSKRTILIVLFVVALSVLVWFLLILQRREPRYVTGSSYRAHRVSPEKTVRSALADPVDFTKKRVTGGIGIILTTDQQTSLPAIAVVLPDSPAHTAGLSEGDLILKVNGIGTTNKPLVQVASDVKGITAGFVTLTVQRNGSNGDYTIQRSSWNSLEQKNLRD